MLPHARDRQQRHRRASPSSRWRDSRSAPRSRPKRTSDDFFAHGGRVPYLLEMAQKFKTNEDFDRFRADWEMTYAVAAQSADPRKRHQVQADRASACRTRRCSKRGCSPSTKSAAGSGARRTWSGDLSRATFSNIEQLALEFVKMTLSAWLTRWEQELWRCVLTPEEKTQSYFFKHNLNALLRGDFQSRMAGYATMLQNGIASVDEIRDLEDWNPLPDGIGDGLPHPAQHAAAAAPTGARRHAGHRASCGSAANRNRTDKEPSAMPSAIKTNKNNLRMEIKEISRRWLVHRDAERLQRRRSRQGSGRARRLHEDDQGSRQ